MLGLDTNILVRYLVKDDRHQAEKAIDYISKAAEKGEPCFINCIVLCELVWVLESAYECSKLEIAGVLDKIITTKQFEVESKDVVRQAVQDYKYGKGDFADYIIGRLNHLNGCIETATFDQSLKSARYFNVIK